MNTVGFDFGTTNSLVSLIQGGRAINFFDDRGLPIPSVVCYEGPQPIVGRDAKERLANAGLGVYGNIVRSPKTLLGKESVFVEGVERGVVDVVADVVKAVRAQALRSRGRELKSLDAAVATIPVSFEGHRRAALRDAFRKAGVRIVQFVHELLAALYGHFKTNGDVTENLRRYERKIVLVFDWGGGTLDLTLCRVDNGTLLQVRNDGTDEVGGDLFDEALQHELLREVRATRGLAESVKVHPDAHARLLHKCEQAKIDLSTRDSVEVYVDHFFRDLADDALQYRLSRQQLQTISERLINIGIERINSLLAAANVSPAQVALCLATGGMVNVPLIKSRLHEIFGAQRVHISSQSGSAIAEGAAWVAHDNAKLQLAKHVELSLARNSFLPLIHAGTEMPTEGEVRGDTFQLYCVDPRDGCAKFQLVSPTRPGQRILPNDPRDVLGTMTLDVDPHASPFFERIELEVSVDDNLILHGKARSLVYASKAELEVHNLEFAVAMGSGTRPADEVDVKPPHTMSPTLKHEKGSITIRANLSAQNDPAFVPGELQYQLDANYFDVRQSPPAIQVDEKLYYERCAECNLYRQQAGRAGVLFCQCGQSRRAAG